MKNHAQLNLAWNSIAHNNQIPKNKDISCFKTLLSCIYPAYKC